MTSRARELIHRGGTIDEYRDEETGEAFEVAVLKVPSASATFSHRVPASPSAREKVAELVLEMADLFEEPLPLPTH